MLRTSDDMRTALESLPAHCGTMNNEERAASLTDDRSMDTTTLTRKEIEELIDDLPNNEGE